MTRRLGRYLLILGLGVLVAVVALRVIPALHSKAPAPTAPDTTGMI